MRLAILACAALAAFPPPDSGPASRPASAPSAETRIAAHVLSMRAHSLRPHYASDTGTARWLGTLREERAAALEIEALAAGVKPTTPYSRKALAMAKIVLEYCDTPDRYRVARETYDAAKKRHDEVVKKSRELHKQERHKSIGQKQIVPTKAPTQPSATAFTARLDRLCREYDAALRECRRIGGQPTPIDYRESVRRAKKRPD